MFRDLVVASAARSRVIDAGIGPDDITVRGADDPSAATEGRFMGRIVLIIAFWSVIGTAIGAGFGVALALTIGPSGTQGIIIQAVSWAIFAHLIIGMLAGYLLLADRSEREMSVAPEALLVVRCDTIRAAEIGALLRQAGAMTVRLTELPTGS